MNKHRQILAEAVFTIAILLLMFLLSLWTQQLLNTRTMIPMLFVLGVFFVSWKTQGYFWGITASLISVLAVNYAFTYPYYAIDLISPECLGSAIVMLIVSTMTGALTTKIKQQEQVRLDSERERMRANLLRAVSHDLRTPLTTIYGSCSALMEHYDTLTKEQQLTLLSEVLDDSLWLTRMVENLLSVTRIDGSVSLTKTPTVLEELIDTVILQFRKHYPNQVLNVDIPEDFVSIPMDAMLIQQVLVNFLENAVQHAEGMTALTLQVTVSDGKALFRVTDNGCGITLRRMDNLFTGYLEHSDSSATGHRKGMGIGLSVCSSIIKAHNSEIHAENLKSGGATFYFSLETDDI